MSSEHLQQQQKQKQFSSSSDNEKYDRIERPYSKRQKVLNANPNTSSRTEARQSLEMLMIEFLQRTSKRTTGHNHDKNLFSDLYDEACTQFSFSPIIRPIDRETNTYRKADKADRPRSIMSGSATIDKSDTSMANVDDEHSEEEDQRLQFIILNLLSYLRPRISISNNQLLEHDDDNGDDDAVCTSMYHSGALSHADVAILLLQWAFKMISYTYHNHGGIQKPILQQQQQTSSPFVHNKNINSSHLQRTRNVELSNISERIVWEIIATCLEILLIPWTHTTTAAAAGTTMTRRFQYPVSSTSSMVYNQHLHSISTTGNKRISNILTLSVLNKWISLTLRLTFATPILSDATQDMDMQQISPFTATCFSLFISWISYQPTIEFAFSILCDLAHHIQLYVSQQTTKSIHVNHHHRHPIHIITPISTTTISSSNSILSIHQLIVIHSTLRLIQRLEQQQGVVNPKKLFTSFLNTSIFSSFAYLYQLSHTNHNNHDDDGDGDDEQDDKDRIDDVLLDSSHPNTNLSNEKKRILLSIREIIQELFWIAFFHPDHHMEGYRSAPNFTIQSLTVNTSSNHNNSDNKEDLETKNINKSHDHSCYQAQLFKELDSILTMQDKDVHPLPSCNDETPGIGISIPNNILSIVPLLIQGFILNSLKVEERQKRNNALMTGNVDTKNKKIVVDMVKIQFIFWSRVLYPVLEYIHHHHDHESNIHINTHLKIFLSCLQLLSKHQIYHPSNTAIGHVQFKFLSGIVKIMLTTAHGSLTRCLLQKDGDCNASSLTFITSIFLNLLSLNHHLLHDQLHFIIQISTSCFNIAKQKSYQDLEISSRNLLICICEIYQKLRQLKHLFISIIPTTARSNLEPCKSDLIIPYYNEGYLSLLEDPNFIKALTTAVKSSPWAEIQASWLALDTFFKDKDVMSLDDKQNIEKYVDVHIVVNLFIIFLRALPIDETKAIDSQVACERSIQSVIWPIVKRYPFFDLSSTVTNLMLTLFGWMIDVRTKCNFWLGDAMDNQKQDLLLDEGSSYDKQITPRLNATIERMMEAKFPFQVRYAIQQLACHRIQNLHAVLYLSSKEDPFVPPVVTDSNDTSANIRDDMLNEARKLAEFIIFSTWQRRFDANNSGSRESNVMTSTWTLVLKYISTLAAYADEVHIHQVLTWLFNCIAIRIDEYRRAHDSIVVVPHMNPVPLPIFTQERDAAYSVLCDASFFDLAPLMKYYAVVGMKVAVTLLFSAFEPQSHVPPINIQGISIGNVHILSVQDDFSSSNFLSEKQINCVQSQLGMMVGSSDSVTVHYKIQKCDWIIRSGRLLDTLVETLTSDDKHIGSDAFLNYLLRLHLALHVIALSNRASNDENYRLLLDQLMLCQQIIARILPYAHHVVMHCSMVNNFIVYMGKNLLLSLKCSENDIHHYQLVTNVAYCIGAFFMWCFSIEDGDASMMVNVVKGLETSVQFQLNSKDLERALILVRPTISKIIMGSSKAVPAACSDLLELSVTSIFEPISTYVRYTESSHYSNDRVLGHLIFLSDIINILNNFSLASESENIVRREIKFLFVWAFEILQLMGNKLDDMTSTIMYLLFSVSRSRILAKEFSTVDILMKIQRLIVLRHIERGETESILFTVYGELLSHIGNLELVEVVRALHQSVALTNNQSRSLTETAILHCFDYLLSILTSADQRKSLLRDTDAFVTMAINQLEIPRLSIENASAENLIIRLTLSLQGASTVLTTIAKFKTSLYMFQSFEIAEILSKTSIILSGGIMSSLPWDKYSIIFITCCELIHTFLKQFPRLLYGCSPCVIASIRVLLKSILNKCASYRTIEKALNDSIHSFSRLCETLVQHKIFKKHVVGLILDFIDGLDGIDPTLKSEFHTSLFFLLDMLSSHENKQLNALMTEREKSIFAVFHQRYQKEHLYQGQF